MFAILAGQDKQLNDIMMQAEAAMVEKVMAAPAEAAQATITELHENTLKATPRPFEYFASVLH